ncbi:MAG: FixH family protein [Alphaproteobacteria bacterium]|nr:FixH family protein [Alphaproteobacteria bacterium]
MSITMDKPVKPLTGKRFFFYVASFLGFVVVVNIVFITLALKSNSGVVAQDYYQRGINYNQTLDQAEYQKKLGWTSQVDVNGDMMVYTVLDQQSQPVRGRKVAVKMARPVMDGHDFSILLAEQPDGTYQGKFQAPLKGAWDAHISVQWDDGVFYDYTKLVLE